MSIYRSWPLHLQIRIHLINTVIGQPSAIKLVDREILLAERAERILELKEAEKKREERLRAQVQFIITCC